MSNKPVNDPPDVADHPQFTKQVNDDGVLLTRCGERCDRLWRNKGPTKLVIDGVVVHPGAVFYPAPWMNVKALAQSLIASKVRPKTKPQPKSTEE